MCMPFLNNLKMRTALAGALMAMLITPANADLAVAFDEGAPKDRFTFKNVGTCAIGASTLLLDLSGSKAGLIFDVTDSGAGVEVFQPLEIVAGAGLLARIPDVKDGDAKLELKLTELKPGQSIAFTIDVDDTAGGREITISDSEISGARVQLLLAGSQVSGVFGTDAQTTLKLDNC